MSENQNPDTSQIDAETEKELQEFLEVTETDVETLTAKVAELEAQLKDTQLRAQAEIRNIQARAEREVTNAHKFGVEKFANGLLEVVDNLERAVAARFRRRRSIRPRAPGAPATAPPEDGLPDEAGRGRTC